MQRLNKSETDDMGIESDIARDTYQYSCDKLSKPVRKEAITRILKRIQIIYKENGFLCLLRLLFESVFILADKFFRKFKFQSETYKYFVHWDNATWINERAVEIAIIWRWVQKYKTKRVLEVGNVLSHYFSVDHDIVDKYEHGDRVINEDIVDYSSSCRYDLIVSISTVEHIGFDELPKSTTKILDTFENLKKLLAPGGKLIVTLPLGYNTAMDNFLKDGKISFSRQYYMKRISRFNRWEEYRWDGIYEPVCDWPFWVANCLLIGIVENAPESKSSRDPGAAY